MEIGETLKKARMAKGYTYQEIEEATKIRSRYLEAMEEENFNLLPGRVYVLAFLRNYAKYLGLDDEELVSQYKVQYGEKEVIKELPGSKNVEKEVNGKPRYKNYLLALLVVGIMIAVFAVFNGKFNGKGDIGRPDSVQEPGVVENIKDNQQKPPAGHNNENGISSPVPGEVENNNVELVLNIVDDKCWMKVDVDGKTKFTGVAKAGESKKFVGQESVYVKLGNAGVVEVLYNGKNMGTLAGRGEVAEKVFTKQS
ncbi:MAG: helix-turn-helix domain-containing protein [Desulfotomaculum sp.]|nr:helix-turn-helix domain-containing protein [Desulfotomaculum sp.]